MKNLKWIFGICGVVAGIAVAGVCAWFVSNAGFRTMDRKEALGYALEDAALEESDVTITREKLENDDGKNYYEIDFYSSSYTYEYEIDAVNGTVLDVSIEALERPAAMQGNAAMDQPQPSGDIASVPENQNTPENQNASETLPEQDGRIGLDAAKAAALADAGLKDAEVVFSKAELDYDDGKEIYEIEFFEGRTEYEYEIDAVTGAVLSRDTDYDEYDGYRGHHGYRSCHHIHECWYD